MDRTVRRLLALALCLPVLAACVPRAPAPPPPALADKLVLQPAGFADLAGFADDRVAEALPALRRSCDRIARVPDLGIAGGAEDWRQPCAEIAALRAGDDSGLRTVLQRHFAVALATNNGNADGLFTGYYEPTLQGSRSPGARHTVPLLARPGDLVTVDLGQFRDSLKGQRIAGRVEGGALRPYATRGEIEAGALKERAQPIAWVTDPVDAFFLHIQGSGRVELAEGGVMRVGFAAQNGHPYVAIGRSLVQRGALKQEEVSMQSIRAWLAANPGEARGLMQENPSYIFFRELTGEGPLGAQGVALEPGRSLAVDRAHLPLGIPVWLDATQPDADPSKPDRPLRRLLVAQDTGGAIRGPVRGDVFWGHSREAAEIAGRMKHRGRYYLLLPKTAAARIAGR